jgi:hypothetical protein
MRDQITYSTSTSEQQQRDPFTPLNFKDILIPSKETQNKITEKIKDNEFLTFNKEDFLSGKYFDKQYNNLPDIELSAKDTFYRITSIIVQSENSYVFHVRPVGPKFRYYNIEDTYYTNNTLVDVVRDLHKIRYKYNEIVNSEVSQQEMKDELAQHKQTMFEQRMNKRKYILFFNFILVFGGLVAIKIHSNNNLDITTMNSVGNFLINNGKVKSTLGINKLVAISYRFNPFKWEYTINGYIMGTNKFGKFEGVYEMSDRKIKNPKISSIDENNNYHLI